MTCGPGGGHLGSAQNRPDPGHQLLGTERLGQVIVRAQLQSHELVGLVAPGRQHDDGHRVVLAQPSRDVEAVQAGQPEIQHDQVWATAGCRPERARPVAGVENTEAGRLQVVAQQPHDLRLVVHNQDGGHGVMVERQRGPGRFSPRPAAYL